MDSEKKTPLKRKYVRAVGPRLRIVLFVIFVLFALLGANSAYLSSITFLEWARGETYQNYFYQLMFLGHLVLGLLIILPVRALGPLELLSKSIIFADVIEFPLTRMIRPVVTELAVMSNTAPVPIPVASVSKCISRPVVKSVPPSIFNKLPDTILVTLISTILLVV